VIFLPSIPSSHGSCFSLSLFLSLSLSLSLPLTISYSIIFFHIHTTIYIYIYIYNPNTLHQPNSSTCISTTTTMASWKKTIATPFKKACTFFNQQPPRDPKKSQTGFFLSLPLFFTQHFHRTFSQNRTSVFGYL